MGAKGRPKTGGRKKGSGVSKELREYLKSKGINLIELILERINNTIEDDRAAELYIKLMHYIYPVPRDSGIDLNNMTVEEIKELGGFVLESLRTRNASDRSTTEESEDN